MLIVFARIYAKCEETADECTMGENARMMKEDNKLGIRMKN